MAFEAIQNWHQLVTEVCVAFDTVLKPIDDATEKIGKLYTRPLRAVTRNVGKGGVHGQDDCGPFLESAS
jgi:hypothetical protein